VDEEPVVSTSSRNGREAENKVAQALRDAGFIHAEPRARRGRSDTGDITGLPGVVIEVKAAKELELAKFMNQAEAERANAGADLAVLWHKRRGKSNPEDWYVTISGRTFLELLTAWWAPWQPTTPEVRSE
jgi:hypothetical protein